MQHREKSREEVEMRIGILFRVTTEGKIYNFSYVDSTLIVCLLLIRHMIDTQSNCCFSLNEYAWRLE